MSYLRRRIPFAGRASLLLVSLNLAVFAPAAFCEAAVDPSAESEGGQDLGEVVVTASRVSESASEAPPAVSVVTARDIAARGASSVADALRLAPGLSLSDKGPAGSQVSLSLRGSTTNQVLVLVDGQRASDALSGLADLSSIPLERVERIEVMRGGASSLYGGDAVGGVVNIITKKAAAPFVLNLENGGYAPQARVAGFGFDKATQAAQAADLLDSQKASFSWSPKLGETLLRSSGGIKRAANAYTYIDANGEKRKLENAGLLAGDALVGANLPLGPGSLDAELSGSLDDKGVPGSESSPTLNASQSDARARAAARYSADRFLSDLLSLDASARVDYSSLDYEDADDSSQDAEHRVATAELDVAQRAYVSDGLTLEYGASASRTAAWSDAVGSPVRVAAGAFVEPMIALGRLSLRPSIRYDYYSDFFANDPWGPIGAALGASYELDPGRVLKANLTRSYRVPTFDDLYWPQQSGAAGNSSLKPESAYEANLGYERHSGDFRYTATAYARYSRDVILWQPDASGTWRPSNYGAALYPGLEQELEASLGEGWRLSANYGYLRSYALSGDLSLSDDKRLPMTPEHNLKCSISREDGALSWSTTFTYASLRYLKVANVAYLPSYFVLDAMARWKLSRSTSVYVAADNVLDEQYQVVEGYPMPGARLRFGLEYRL